ncbi:MAG: hypothetical protein DRO98_00990 [Archaeoglobales archaeon]|uniref:CopG family transcriptional regulator n=1 Tax=Archaeoglobus veneficus (strain DSM 11195 / SNP6) TaxID=693661 RepID=F2KT66_ARCVS|nr:DUF5371 family protein [Archaeoglobus veneficus]AEA47096.1 hypothetical protein Arcve_1086 [Archaeoglobus veneficus SNP6]RLI89456.1 MAG: hypothetical protein DRO98_00990 [Archaeoglobales archaeon]
MVKIVHAQTVLPEHVLEELKKKTGESATKDAIAKAVEHYLMCPYTHEEPLEKKLEEVLKKKKK